MKHSVLLSLLIAVVVTLMTAITFKFGGHLVSSAQVAASDFFLVQSNGLRLGRRPASSEIVLVLFDKKSADTLGYVHNYQTDLKLYQRLIDSEAKVIFDTRLIAAGTEEAFEELRPLLNGMRDLDASGKLMRDIWLSTQLQQTYGAQWEHMLVQNVINSHPHEYPSITSRLYPLAYFDSRGANESAPLAICRQFWQLPRRTPAEVGEELRSSGVMALWHEMSPQLVPESKQAVAPYSIAQHQIVWHPFLPASVLVPPAAFWVSYDPQLGDYQRYSYSDLLPEAAEIAPAAGLSGKIVIIGFDAAIDPGSDTYTVPNLLGKAASAEVVATAVQTLIDDRSIRAMPTSLWCVFALVLIGTTALVAGLARPLHAVLICAAILLAYFIACVAAYHAGWFADFLLIPLGAVLSAIPAGAVNAWLSLRARQRVVDLFGRYVPRAIVNQLIQRTELESLTLGGSNREVTVMFADIRGFTSFSQDLTPEEVVRQLNSLLEIMVACTFEFDGTLDKFIGDAILVLFNTPLDQPDHSLRAVKTALAIQQRLATHESGLKVGIGVHRGLAVVGNIGTPQRMEYTAIGSTVNMASRLCDLAQPGEVIVSQVVLEHLDPKAVEVHDRTATLKGFSAPVAIASVLSINDGTSQ